MNKFLLFLMAILVVAVGVMADPDQNRMDVLTPSVTSLSGVNTNSNAGTNMTFQTGPQAARIFMTGQAVTGATNAVGVFTATIVTSPDGTTWDSVVANSTALTNTTIKLSFTLQSTNATTVSDWFNVSGVRAIRVNRLENLFPQAITNLSFKVGYPNQ